MEISVTAYFYDNKLFQVGDFVNGAIGFLDTIGGSGFNSYKSDGQITKIIIQPDTICNSCLLNGGHSVTYAGGLGIKFVLDNKETVYAFEHKKLWVPYLMTDKINYLNQYFAADCTEQIFNRYASFLLHHDNGYVLSKKRVGAQLHKHFRYLFDYFFICLNIRSGLYGNLNEGNFTKIADENLRKYCDYSNLTTNKIRIFTDPTTRLKK